MSCAIRVDGLERICNSGLGHRSNRANKSFSNYTVRIRGRLELPESHPLLELLPGHRQQMTVVHALSLNELNFSCIGLSGRLCQEGLLPGRLAGTDSDLFVRWFPHPAGPSDRSGKPSGHIYNGGPYNDHSKRGGRTPSSEAVPVLTNILSHIHNYLFRLSFFSTKTRQDKEQKMYQHLLSTKRCSTPRRGEEMLTIPSHPCGISFNVL